MPIQERTSCGIISVNVLEEKHTISDTVVPRADSEEVGMARAVEVAVHLAEVVSVSAVEDPPQGSVEYCDPAGTA